MNLRGQKERMASLAIWTWVEILEKEADKLSESGRTALLLLREDLGRIAE